jgi:hypothetical protein
MMSNELPLMTSEQPIDGDSIGRAAPDHDRLKYVIRLLASQQGLNTALLGALIFLLNVDEVLNWLHGWWRFLAGMAWLALLVGGFRIFIADRVPKYYERRFGSVQAARVPGSRWNALFGLAVLLAFAVLLFFGRPIAHYFDPVASHLHMMISDPDRQINLWPSVYWVLLLCGALRWHMSSIERQRLYFLLVGTLGCASIISSAIWHQDAKQLGLWKILNAGGFGLSLIALGLYDHIVLVRALPKTVAEGNDE